jgi:hypothetical protein
MTPRCTTLAAALLAALAVSGCGDRGPGDATPADPGPSTSGTPAPEVPDDLTCPTGRRENGTIDYVQFPGFASAEETAGRFLHAGETLAVDRVGADDAEVWVLRTDGTARMRVTAHHGSEGWYPDTIESCEGEGPGSAASPLADPAAPPAGITCDGDVVRAIFDFVIPRPDGPASALEAARAWGGVDGDVVVLGADGHTAFVLRADGSAHTELTLVGEDGHGWAVEGYQACEGEGPITSRRTEVLLDVGHCWVEPFAFDGVEWALPTGDQFGWGGHYPEGISGEGHAVRDTAFDDTLAYTDDEGGRLTFRPSSDPRTALPGGGICD